MRHSYFAIIVVLFWSFLGTSVKLHGQEKDLSHIDVYLHTFDVGNLIYTNFGHTALRVKDNRSGRDLIYNWGIFDFKDPLSFSLDYYRGNLIYKLGIYPSRRAMQHYRREGRRIWEDQLVLSDHQKGLLLEKLAWNSRPENRDYLYQYFFDNCSTRPRDFIDYALGGVLAEKTKGVDRGKSFRQMVRDGYTFNPWMDVILEIGMNSRIDRNMTRWESMFHPIELRNELFELRINGQSIIGESHQIFDGKVLQPLSFDVFKFLLLILGVPVLLALACLQYVALKKDKDKDYKSRLSSWALRITGFVGFIFFLIGGIFGILIPLNWIFSGHQDLHHNANMILFFPFDIFLAPIFAKLCLKGKSLEFGVRFGDLLRKYMIVHLVLVMALFSAWLLDGIGQSLDRVVYLSPLLVLLLSILKNFGMTDLRKEAKTL